MTSEKALTIETAISQYEHAVAHVDAIAEFIPAQRSNQRVINALLAIEAEADQALDLALGALLEFRCYEEEELRIKLDYLNKRNLLAGRFSLATR